MLQISEKGKKIPASPIRKLVPYADRAKERGIKVYHLNIGQPDIATPEVALKAVRQMKLPVIRIYGFRRKSYASYQISRILSEIRDLPDRRRHTDYYRWLGSHSVCFHEHLERGR